MVRVAEEAFGSMRIITDDAEVETAACRLSSRISPRICPPGGKGRVERWGTARFPQMREVHTR